MKFLLEKNRIEYLQDLFPGIDNSTFIKISNVDPTPNKKCLQWLLNQYKRGHDVFNLRKYLIDFKGDINKYDSESIKKLDNSGVKVIYQDDKVEVVQPLTFSASKKWGSDKWCVSNDKKWWNAYMQDKKIIYIANIKDKNILNQLANIFKDDSLVFLHKGEDIKKNGVSDPDDYSKLGICFDNGLEIWIKPNYILNKNLNYKFLKIVGIENVIFKN